MLKMPVCLGFFLFLLLATTPAHAEKRVALVIGNSAYKHIPSLPNPSNDARLIADTLRGLGFELAGGDAHFDLDKASLDRSVQEFGRAIQGADVALFYYAGHGVQVRGHNYLVPVAANPVREADVDFQMLDANLVMRQMEGSGARLNVVILDACRNNPLGGRGLRSAGSGLAQMQAPEGTLISFATQPGAVALDGTGRNSPYTAALADVIRKPGLDIFRTFNAVGLAVKQATAGAQQPWVSSSPISGDFFFAGRVTDSGTAAKSDDGRLTALQKELEELRAKVNKKPDEPKVAVGVFPQQPETAPQGQYKPGDEFQDCDTCPKMVVVPAGSFVMGSSASETGRQGYEGPQRRVTIPAAFAVGKFEVTKAQFEAFASENGHIVDDKCWTREGGTLRERSGRSWQRPGFSQSGDHPVTCVTWEDARIYVAWLSKKTGKDYKLLTEAQWEYAARAGTTTPFSTGQLITTDQANFDGSADTNGAPKGQNRQKTVPVGSFAANAFGLHDMHGNVQEWLEDCWSDSYSGAPTDGSARTTGDCGRRVLRGGAWTYSQLKLRSALRNGGLATFRSNDYGFRVARTLTP